MTEENETMLICMKVIGHFHRLAREMYEAEIKELNEKIKVLEANQKGN